MQIGPRIKFDRHTLGNLAKNISPALAFTPLGLGGTAALSALGDLGRGKNLKQAAGGAAKNVAIGAGARGVAGHFNVLGQGTPAAPSPGNLPGAHATPVGAPTPAPVPGAADLLHSEGPVPTLESINASRAAGAAGDVGGGAAGAVADEGAGLAPEVTGMSPPTSTPGGAFHTLGRIGSGILDHDRTTAAVLGGLGNLGTAGAQNRAQNAQARLLETQAAQNEYDANRAKARDLAMEPLRQALYGQLGKNFASGA